MNARSAATPRFNSSSFSRLGNVPGAGELELGLGDAIRRGTRAYFASRSCQTRRACFRLPSASRHSPRRKRASI